MRTVLLVACVLVIICGCAGPTFTNLGNGTAVPSDYIDKVAHENDITRDEAKKLILADIEQNQQTDSK